MLNSILRIHMDDFLNFFTLVKTNSDFFNMFYGELFNLSPANVLLNGLDEKLYVINDEKDIERIGPYQRAKKEKTLQNLLPLKGR